MLIPSSAFLPVKVLGGVARVFVGVWAWLIPVIVPSVVGVLIFPAKMYILLSPYRRFLVVILFVVAVSVSVVAVLGVLKGAPVAVVKIVSVRSPFALVHITFVCARS